MALGDCPCNREFHFSSFINYFFIVLFACQFFLNWLNRAALFDPVIEY